MAQEKRSATAALRSRYALILLLVLICFFIEVLSQGCLQWRAPGATSPGRLIVFMTVIGAARTLCKLTATAQSSVIRKRTRDFIGTCGFWICALFEPGPEAWAQPDFICTVVKAACTPRRACAGLRAASARVCVTSLKMANRPALTIGESPRFLH